MPYRHGMGLWIGDWAPDQVRCDAYRSDTLVHRHFTSFMYPRQRGEATVLPPVWRNPIMSVSREQTAVTCAMLGAFPQTARRGVPMSAQTDNVSQFRALHQGGDVLLLANAWDAGSAGLIAASGAKAIATTSSGVAWSCGYDDGSALPIGRLMVTVADIIRVCDVPVSIDIEDGYSDDPAAVADLAVALAEAGASGVNLEDKAAPPEGLAAKLSATREALKAAGLDLYLNARTDVYLRRIAQGPAAVEETLKRAAIYRAAGADGLFVPALADAEAMQVISTGAQGLPLNVMAVPNLPELAVMRDAGVRRLSLGGAISGRAFALARDLAAGFLKTGSLAEVYGGPSLNYAETNALFKR
jgi:2-methylisocitrate lyase-like PEP mutase family enzyme